MAAALKMDGTVRAKRQLKRLTKELPFHIELQFVAAYKEGLAVLNGEKLPYRDFSQSPALDAGYAAGRAGQGKEAAFASLQAFAAKHGFHRD